jgi:transposase
MILRFKKKDYELELTVSEYNELFGNSCEPRELPISKTLKKRGRPKKYKGKVEEDSSPKLPFPEMRGRKKEPKTPEELEYIKFIKQLVQDNPTVRDKEIIQKIKEKFNIDYSRDKVRYWRKTTPKELVM